MWVKGWVGVSGESYGNQQGWDQPTVNAVVQIRFHRDFIKKWWQNPSSWWSGTILSINRKPCWWKSDTCGASPFFLGLMHLKPTKKSCGIGGRSATEWALLAYLSQQKLKFCPSEPNWNNWNAWKQTCVSPSTHTRNGEKLAKKTSLIHRMHAMTIGISATHEH